MSSGGRLRKLASSTLSKLSLKTILSQKAMTLQYDTATNDEIIQHCLRSNPNQKIISEFEGGLSVIQISEDVVVKCGIGVTQLEAQNQRQAYEMINPAVIRIPKVYRSFTNGLIGYIIMEYINGRLLSSVEDPNNYLDAVVKILEHFEQVRHVKPGPFHGGIAYGELWLDYESIAPATISDIEKYYNERQLKPFSKLELARYPLVFCHLDIAPRNILVLEDGSLCLIDWATAGFYPRLFERCALRLNIRQKDDWNAKLIDRLSMLDEHEKSQVALLEKAYYLGQRYMYYLNKKQKPSPYMIAPGKAERKAARLMSKNHPLLPT